MHRNDSQLILFVDPDEERLFLVVEDPAALRPVAIQSASFKEAITFLKQEMVGDQLVLHVLLHAIERVESALEVPFEATASLDDGLHDLVALVVGDSRAEREPGKIPANSDSRRFDHRGLLFREWWAIELFGIHV